MAYYATCRYGKMLLIGKFKRDKDDLRKRQKCVVRTERGREVAELLTSFQPIPKDMPTEAMELCASWATGPTLSHES